jgi:hypothetical protein
MRILLATRFDLLECRTRGFPLLVLHQQLGLHDECGRVAFGRRFQGAGQPLIAP